MDTYTSVPIADARQAELRREREQAQEVARVWRIKALRAERTARAGGYGIAVALIVLLIAGWAG